MSKQPTAYLGAEIFDGESLRSGHALVVEGGHVAAVAPADQIGSDCAVFQLDGGVIAPGFVDLQVNGGGGVMFNDDPSAATLRRIAAAHARLGATAILPTLITDTAERTRAAIEATAAAVAQSVPGIVGLHLEGPHIALRRKGAHDPRYIRPMTDADLATLLDAAGRLPVLKVTLAPEFASPDQIRRLAQAGVLVSLGHSDATHDDCLAAAQAGARCATHLFNAMSQLGSRQPGLVGAALNCGALSAGLIADGIHVHPVTVSIALRAKAGPGRVFLVSDAMAVAGTGQQGFDLGGRRVTRRDGRLCLEDGTLAGADLDLATAIRNLLRWGAATPREALAMATSIPAGLIGRRSQVGHLAPGTRADFLHFHFEGDSPPDVWIAGTPLER